MDLRNHRVYAAFAALALFATTVAIFALTASPSLNFEDPTEFALGAAALGVDHPSGYPLETLWAHLFTYVPASSLPWRMNLSSSVAAALACVFLFLGVIEYVTPALKRKWLAVPGAWTAAGLIAFSTTFWGQALILEVYALNAMLFAATAWAACRCYAGGDARWFYTATFLAALGAANHPATLVLTLPLLVSLGYKLRDRGIAPLLGRAAAAAFLALSTYLYLAIRASQDPPLNWGTPYRLGTFIDHIRRREFGTIYWPRYRYLGAHALDLGRMLWYQFGAGVGLLAAFGAALLAARRVPLTRMAITLAVIAGPCMLFPLVGLLTPIQVFEMDVWFIPFFFLAAAFAGAGAAVVIDLIPKRAFVGAAAVAVSLLPFYPFVYNAGAVDWRGYDYAADYGRNLLRTYPYRTVLLISFYDRLGLFEQTYLKYVDGRRGDVILADSRGYVRGMVSAREAPRHIADADAAELWWLEYRHGLLASAGDDPLFSNGGEPDAAAWGARAEPFGISFAVRGAADTAARPVAPPWTRYDYAGGGKISASLGKSRSPYEPTTYRIWANYYATASRFCFQQGRADAGLRNLAIAERAAPRDYSVAWLLASIYDANGYAADAIRLYRVTLSHFDPYKNDALMFQLLYADLARSLGLAYVKNGDAAAGRRFLEESLKYSPHQPALRTFLEGNQLEREAEVFRGRARVR